MKLGNYFRCVLLACVMAVLAICAAGCAAAPVAQLQSPDGEIELAVYRADEDSFRWEHTKGPDWAFSGWNIGGVTDFKMGTFSPDSRHAVLIFMDESGEEQYHWTDYENSMSGGIDFEIACKAEETFAQSIREEKGIWTDISFRFLDWHGDKNWMLFRYTLTTADGTTYSGHFWVDLDTYLEKDAVKIMEITN